jgi:IS30 family transposase
MEEIRRFSARPWTEPDDNTLRALAMFGMSARSIGRQINRTGAAVRARIRRLKITLIKSDLRVDRTSRSPSVGEPLSPQKPPQKRSRPPARRWTSSEDDKLRDMLDVGRTADEIAVEVNRTHSAIYSRLQRLYRKGAREARVVELGLKVKK